MYATTTTTTTTITTITTITGVITTNDVRASVDMMRDLCVIVTALGISKTLQEIYEAEKDELEALREQHNITVKQQPDYEKQHPKFKKEADSIKEKYKKVCV